MKNSLLCNNKVVILIENCFVEFENVDVLMEPQMCSLYMFALFALRMKNIYEYGISLQVWPVLVFCCSWQDDGRVDRRQFG